MILHAAAVVAATTFSALSFWGIVVIDSRRQHQKLVDDVRTGRATVFVAGGVVYCDAQDVDGSSLLVARPVHPEGSQKAAYVVIDPISITKALSRSSLGLPEDEATTPSDDMARRESVA